MSLSQKGEPFLSVAILAQVWSPWLALHLIPDDLVATLTVPQPIAGWDAALTAVASSPTTMSSPEGWMHSPR